MRCHSGLGDLELRGVLVGVALEVEREALGRVDVDAVDEGILLVDTGRHVVDEAADVGGHEVRFVPAAPHRPQARQVLVHQRAVAWHAARVRVRAAFPVEDAFVGADPGFPRQDRHQVPPVESAVGCHGDTGKAQHRWEDVVRSCRLALNARHNGPRPGHKAWLAHAALPHAPFAVAERTRPPSTELVRRPRPVVASEEHDRVVGLPGLSHRTLHLPDHPVKLLDDIAK